MSPRSWSMLATGFLLSLLTSFTGACTRSLPSGISSPSGGLASPATIDAPAPLRPLAPSNAAIHEAFGRIPLHFEENRGQADPAFRFLARTAGGTLGFGPTGMFVRSKDHSVRVSFEGATPGVRLTTLDELPGRVNYLRGRDSRRWQTNIATYAGGGGADHANGIAVDASGNAYAVGGTASTDFPVAGGPQPVKSGGFDAFVVKLNATGTTLLYATYLGGSLDDEAMAVAVDSEGNAYVAGYTYSPESPTAKDRPGVLAGGAGADAFVAKLNASC